MKKIETNKYPNSATLFKFCKTALENKYNGSIKIIDQDVGAILGYDPADCSHWKKGKKNIKSLSTIKNIAEHLNVDERLLIDITSGEINLEEALFEYKGYGDFELDVKSIDILKKNFFSDTTNWQSEKSNSVEEYLRINREAISGIVDYILERGNYTEAPIYLPEVFSLFPGVILEEVGCIETAVKVIHEHGVTKVQYKDREMKPFVRYLCAKELFNFLCYSSNQLVQDLKDLPSLLLNIHANLFAGMLLIPTRLLQQEIGKVQSSLDIVDQLSRIFWVSKSLMNKRLKDCMTHSR